MVATQLSQLIDLIRLSCLQPPQELKITASSRISLLFEHLFELVCRFGDLNFDYTSHTFVLSEYFSLSVSLF